MMNRNKWNGVGRLLKDPEFVPASAKGDAHMLFTVVVNRVVPRESGPKPDYIPCAFWGSEQLISKLCEELKKGDEVGAKGRIYTDRILDRVTGQYKHFWEVRVMELQTGMRSLKNLAQPVEDKVEETAVARLHGEFSG